MVYTSQESSGPELKKRGGSTQQRMIVMFTLSFSGLRRKSDPTESAHSGVEVVVRNNKIDTGKT